MSLDDIQRDYSGFSSGARPSSSANSISLSTLIAVAIILLFAFFIFFYAPAPSVPASNISPGTNPLYDPTNPYSNSLTTASAPFSPDNSTFGISGTAKGSLLTNAAFIDGLYSSDVNLGDPKAVLKFVLDSLPDKVVVYPTENYFYFRFTAQGQNVKGSLSFFAHNRDEGYVGIGYIVFNEFPDTTYDNGRLGGGAEFNDANGVVVKKISDFDYTVTLGDRTVEFILNDVGLVPPQKAQLLPSEQYVGTSFDESGLKFVLIYNRVANRVYWVLNEDGVVAEEFKSYLPEKHLVKGYRTHFVLYDDANHSRKILVGAKGENVLANNWYDGPFDQMPDNYVKIGKIDYDAVMRAYYAEGRVNQYLGYYTNEGTRIAVAPYTVYFDASYFDFIGECEDNQGSNLDAFYACITVQQYNLPRSSYPDASSAGASVSP